ncbi:hypothetical protein DSO57_1028616 [Entomophthora muscae]|uniref:Uncharacterized protein n=1 Tax=Entomophthora muscae TaxID=34485 RepID=A0ACC2TZX7_9FUNG|nr:hypothetical protein DSO57_1028616 [Entomophthora muscae]
MLLWTTSPNLRARISSSVRLMGDNPSILLHLHGELFISGEAVVKSLACDDLDLYADDYTIPSPSLEELLATMSGLTIHYPRKPGPKGGI